MDEYALAPNNPYTMEADPYQKGVQFFQVRRETKKKSTEKCVTIFARTGDLLRPFLLWKLLSPGTKSMALLGICWERLIKRFVRDLFWFVDSIIFFIIIILQKGRQGLASNCRSSKSNKLRSVKSTGTC